MTEYAPAVTPEQQSQMLDAALMRAAMGGWRLVARAGNEAVVQAGKPPNHILHAILSAITIGFWLPVWLILGMSMKVIQTRIMVDAWGRTFILMSGQWQPI